MKTSSLFVMLILLACNSSDSTTIDPYAHIQDVKARQIIRNSITDAGGLEKWKSIQSIHYKKNFELLKEDGTIEKTYKQDHSYDFPKNEYVIQSEENGDNIISSKINTLYTRSKNGENLDTDPETIQKSINSSVYVLAIPFKLLDPGAKISYLGVDTISSVPVDVIQADYDPAKNENHSSKNAWKFYFDQKNSRIIANWIESSDHFNIVENLEFERVEGILFHKHRKSYRVNEDNEKLYLRAEYKYFDYNLKK